MNTIVPAVRSPRLVQLIDDGNNGQPRQLGRHQPQHVACIEIARRLAAEEQRHIRRPLPAGEIEQNRAQRSETGTARDHDDVTPGIVDVQTALRITDLPDMTGPRLVDDRPAHPPRGYRAHMEFELAVQRRRQGGRISPRQSSVLRNCHGHRLPGPERDRVALEPDHREVVPKAMVLNDCRIPRLHADQDRGRCRVSRKRARGSPLLPGSPAQTRARLLNARGIVTESLANLRAPDKCARVCGEGGELSAGVSASRPPGRCVGSAPGHGDSSRGRSLPPAPVPRLGPAGPRPGW